MVEYTQTNADSSVRGAQESAHQQSLEQDQNPVSQFAWVYQYKVLISKGLHSRPCAKLTSILKVIEKVNISCNGNTANGSSILELLLLKASYGSEITIACDRPIPQEVLEELDLFFNGKEV